MLVMYFCIVICCCKGKEDSNSATRLEDASKIKEGVAPDENSLPERDQTNSNEFSKQFKMGIQAKDPNISDNSEDDLLP